MASYIINKEEKICELLEAITHDIRYDEWEIDGLSSIKKAGTDEIVGVCIELIKACPEYWARLEKGEDTVGYPRYLTWRVPINF